MWMRDELAAVRGRVDELDRDHARELAAFTQQLPAQVAAVPGRCGFLPFPVAGGVLLSWCVRRIVRRMFDGGGMGRAADVG